MATPPENLGVSRLEQLPTQIIDRILDFTLVPRNLRAGTPILRTTKCLNNAATKYLHKLIPWITLRLNLSLQEIRKDPYLRHGYISNTEDQRSPDGIMTACIHFPSPSSASQEHQQFGGPLDTESFHSILILAEDLEIVMSRLRTYDLALCHRILPHDGTPVELLDRDRPCGLCIDIETRPKPDIPTFSERLYKQWLNAFSKLSGPFHQVTFSGQDYFKEFKRLRDVMELRRHDENRLREILDHKAQTRHEALEAIMRLKNRGDELLLCAELRADEHYHEAFLHYQHAIFLGSLWNANDRQPVGSDFWSKGNVIRDFHVLACYCNMAIAYLVGDLQRLATSDDAQATTKAFVSEPFQLPENLCSRLMNSGFADEDPHRYTELYYVAILVQIIYQEGLLQSHEAHAIQELRTYLLAMDMLFGFHARQPELGLDSTIVGHMHTHCTSLRRDPVFAYNDMNSAASPSPTRLERTKLHDTVEKMRNLVRGVRIAPVQWCMHPQEIPESFRDQLQAIAPAKHVSLRNLGRRTYMTGIGDEDFSLDEVVMFPNTVWLTDQEHRAGQTTPRHRI